MYDTTNHAAEAQRLANKALANYASEDGAAITMALAALTHAVLALGQAPTGEAPAATYSIDPAAMSTYYKAVRPDGTDFHSGTVQWIPSDGVIPAGGWLVKHPTSKKWDVEHASNLRVSTVPTNCTGMEWPCRLLEVKPSRHKVHEHGTMKRSALSWRVVRELPAWQALGPQGQEVAAIIEAARRLTQAQVKALYDAWAAAWDAARDAAWAAAWDAARDAAWAAAWAAARDAAANAAGYAAWDAACATLVRDRISDEHYQTLMGPWLSVVGEA